MNTKKYVIMLSILASALFSANTTFTRGGGWIAPVAILGTAAVVSSASNAAARDRDYAYYQAEMRDRDYARDRDMARFREDALRREYEDKLAREKDKRKRAERIAQGQTNNYSE